MDSSITEEIAINKLNGVLLKTKIIKPEIKSNDKYPSWDGELLVYKSSSLVKSNLEARVPVQVKGHYSEEPFEKEISYAYDIDDLNNYFIDGGVFFFVIFINETDLFAIYYDELLPFDLKKLIHKASIKNTKTISTKLKIIPDNNHKYLLTQIKNFILNREKQAGKIKLSSSDTPKDINVDQLTFNLVDIRNFNDLFEQPVYLYRTFNDFEIPIDKTYIREVSFNNPKEKITVGPIIHYLPTKYCFSPIEQKLFIGKSFLYDIINKKFNFSLKGSLTERIADLEMFKNLVKYKTIQIGASPASPTFNFEFSRKQNEQLKHDLEYLHKVENLLLNLYVEKDLDFNILTKTDFENIDLLLGFYNKNSSATLDDFGESSLAKMVIGNITIALGINKTGYRAYQIMYPFNNSFLTGRLFIVDESDNKYQCSLAACLEKSNFLEFSNLNYDVIINSITSIPYTPTYGMKINDLGLEAVKAFDINKNKKLLVFSKQIYSWLLKNDDKNIPYVLNYYQCLLRERNFTNEEIEALIKLKETAEDATQILGISILLGNKNESDYYFGKLLEEEKETFKKFPIYNLWENSLDFK